MCLRSQHRDRRDDGCRVSAALSIGTRHNRYLITCAFLFRARPEYTLAPGRDRADAFVDELLHALSFVGLGRIDVALRIGGNAVLFMVFPASSVNCVTSNTAAS